MNANFESAANDLDKNGYAIIENFLSADELNTLNLEFQRLIDEHVELVESGKARDYSSSDYDPSLSEKDELVFSLENQALDDNGNLKENYVRELSYARIGYVFYVINEVFRKTLTNNNIVNLFKALGYKKPIIVSSIIHPKFPKIGTKIYTHRDSWDLYTKPHSKTITICFMLDNTTIENGCLQFIPGSHIRIPSEEKRKIVIKGDLTKLKDVTLVGEDYEFKDNEFVNAEVKKGGIIILDGRVMHKSGVNASNKRRAVYTVLCYDAAQAKIDERSFYSDNGSALDVNENKIIKRCS